MIIFLPHGALGQTSFLRCWRSAADLAAEPTVIIVSTASEFVLQGKSSSVLCSKTIFGLNMTFQSETLTSWDTAGWGWRLRWSLPASWRRNENLSLAVRGVYSILLIFIHVICLYICKGKCKALKVCPFNALCRFSTRYSQVWLNVSSIWLN